jgi:hypothetical protein
MGCSRAERMKYSDSAKARGTRSQYVTASLMTTGTRVIQRMNASLA